MSTRSMDCVLWIGGGSGAGKTSVARALSRRYDLELYAADARGYAYLARATGSAQPAESPDDRWLLHTPEELVERFLAGAAEKFPLVLEDLAALEGGTLVIAEGPTMLPDLIRPHVASPAHALYLVPTDEFSERLLLLRGGGRTLGTSDPERAHAARLARNRILNRTIRERAASLGLPIVEVDGSLSLEQTERLVADRFTAALHDGPRATDGEERRRIRRRENAAAHANATAYLHDIGVVDLDAAPPLPLGCECRTHGCVAEVRSSPGAYAEVLDRPGRYVVAHGHASTGEVVVGAAGDASVVEAAGDDGVEQGD